MGLSMDVWVFNGVCIAIMLWVINNLLICSLEPWKKTDKRRYLFIPNSTQVSHDIQNTGFETGEFL